MRIVAFADCHYQYQPLREIMFTHPSADVYLFLGDGEMNYLKLCGEFPGKAFYSVSGNCDIQAESPVENLLLLGGKKIFYTHGHTYRVKKGLEPVKRRARELDADILLFGHTHLALADYEDGLYILNPGSLFRPVGGELSYGIVDITGAGIAPHIARLGRERN